MTTEQPKKPETTTHVAVKVNAKPPQRIDMLKTDMVKDIRKFMVYYNGNRDEANRFILAAIEYVRRVPKLLECDRESLGMALLQSAQFKFMPSGVSGEAYVIPYGRDAKFQIGYQGLITLLYRTGKIKAITSNIIYANDVFEYEEGLEAKLVHKPALFGKPKGDPIGVYTIAHLAGGQKTFKVMDKDAILAIKDLSKAKDAKDSPWNGGKDPELWMWKKTCLIQHSKLLPRNSEIQKAIEEDFKGEGMEKHTLDAAGPAVPTNSHKPAEEPIKEAEIVPEASTDEFTEEDKARIQAEEAREADQGTIEM